MTDKAHAPNRIVGFFLLTYAFSWLFWIPQALAANGLAIPQGLAAFLSGPLNPAAFGPLVAALILSLAGGGWKAVVALLKRGVDARFRKVWLVPILLLPPVIFAGGVLLSVAVGATPLDTSVLSNPPFAIIGFVVVLLTAGPLQEEFGWRGYALPRLQGRFNALAASLVLGVLWWLWHLPLAFVPGRFMANGLGLFLALAPEIILVSILFTWIYNNTGGSVLAALLFHAAMNWSIWIVLPAMQVNLAIIGFTVLLLAVAVAVVVARWGPARLSR